VAVPADTLGGLLHMAGGVMAAIALAVVALYLGVTAAGLLCYLVGYMAAIVRGIWGNEEPDTRYRRPDSGARN
jgi:hypothetical protein